MHGDRRHARSTPSGGRRTAELIPGARFELIEGMGHDYPPQYWDRLVSLVTEHARAEPPEAPPQPKVNTRCHAASTRSSPRRSTLPSVGRW